MLVKVCSPSEELVLAGAPLASSTVPRNLYRNRVMTIPAGIVKDEEGMKDADHF